MIGIFLGVLMSIAIAILNAVLFLLRRFDVTNSILVSGIVQMLSIDQKWNTALRWCIFLIILVACLLLQHMFKVAQILFSISSILALGFFGYVWKSYDSSLTQMLVTISCMAIGVLLNFVSWTGIKMDKVAEK